ncbi:MAG TPA: PP2C family protein-serine/threonine phosphatase [Thermoanaerobaculia bacterium]
MAAESPAADLTRHTAGAREVLREIVISIGVGVGVIYLATLGEASRPGVGAIAYGGLIGLFIYTTNASLGVTCGRWFGRVPIVSERTARAIFYFFGGCIGWLLATLVANGLGLVQVPMRPAALKVYLPLAGAVALLVGLSFYTYSLMRERLEKSVARLKEAEFAEKELELARTIQSRLLPPPQIEGEGYRIDARNVPARYVAGDFYDVFYLADGALGIVVADVSGKGIGASLIMASVKAVLPLLAAERSVEETLRELNRRLAPQLSAREFVALLYLRYEPRTGAFFLGNAGLPDPYLLREIGKPAVVTVPGPRLPLGARRDVGYEMSRGTLAPGERMLFVTDGLPEAPVADGGPLGYERLEALLAASPPKGSSLDLLLASVRAATKPVLEDDWTVLLLERTMARP